MLRLSCFDNGGALGFDKMMGGLYDIVNGSKPRTS